MLLSHNKKKKQHQIFAVFNLSIYLCFFFNILIHCTTAFCRLMRRILNRTIKWDWCHVNMWQQSVGWNKMIRVQWSFTSACGSAEAEKNRQTCSHLHDKHSKNYFFITLVFLEHSHIPAIYFPFHPLEAIFTCKSLARSVIMPQVSGPGFQLYQSAKCSLFYNISEIFWSLIF